MMSVRAVAAAVELSGVERARFLAEIGADVSLLDDVHARVSLAEYDRVVDAALAHSGDPALGLHMGERLAACSFDVLLPFHELSGSFASRRPAQAALSVRHDEADCGYDLG